MVKNTLFFQQHGSAVNWDPDYVKDIENEMTDLLNAHDGNYHLPKKLLQTAGLLGLNPFDMVKSALYEHFHPDQPAYEMIEKAQLALGDERRTLWRAVFKRIHEDIVPSVMLFHMVGYARVGKRINYKPSMATNNEIQLEQITFNQ